MRKGLFYVKNKSWFLFLMAAFALYYTPNAQPSCGTSSFNTGGTLTPTATWNNISVGSGTFTNFTVQPNRIYSFDYANTANAPYSWDMTLSSSSGVIPYNNSVTPIWEPWSGGSCVPINRAESTEWWSGSVSSTITVNTHAWNGACNAHVPGLNSALLSYKECIPAADPGSGVNVWNVEAFATADIDIPIPAARYGRYIDNNLSFSTAAFWLVNSNPSTASGWSGCEVPNDNFTIRARRTGFNCGVYTISDDAHDDNIRIYVNGSPIYNAGCCTPGGVVGNISGYALSATDEVEIRLVDICSNGGATVGINPQTVPAIDGGVIGGIADGSSVCEGNAIGSFTNISGATGGVTGFANGGVYTYDWELSTDGGGTYTSQGINAVTWNSANTVPPGSTYVIRRKVTDKCNNTDYSNTISVIGRPTPNGSMAPVNQTICPGTAATITLNFNPGTAPFNVGYTDGVSNFTATGLANGGTISVSPLATSNYLFTSIQDTYGCARTSSFTGGATVTVVPDITYNAVTPTDALCNGGNSGSITISATGGSGGLTYSIDGGTTYQASNVFTGLAAGTYNVVVQDNFGCIKPYGTPVVINQPTDITQTLAGTDASCANVFDGTITVTATGGTGAYSYSLNGGPLQPGNVFTGIGAGTYLVGVYDANGCEDTSSITLGNSYIISVGLDSQSNVSCAGAADGSLTVHVNGGIPPYTYSINGATYQSSGTFSGLAAGTYIVIGRDSKGCTETVNVTITQPAPVAIAIDSVNNVLCSGTSTANVFITVTGGTPAYSFNWNGGAYVTEDLTAVPAGIYNVTATDSKGCFASAGVIVTEPLPLFLNVASYNDLLCAGDSSGAIDITANGGVPAYSYVWSNGATTEDIVDLKLGTYTVTVTDANSCTTTLTQVISEPTPLVATVVATDATCFGAANGLVDLTVTGGTPSYSFLWSTFETSEDITNIQGGTYNVIITDHNGCQQSQTVVVGEPAELVLNTAVTQISCFNTCDGSIDLTVAGGTPSYTFNWSNGATTEDINSLCGATYSVTVTDANNCTAVTSAVIVTTSAISTSFIVKNPKCFGDTDGSIDLIPSGGAFPYTYVWSTGATTEDLANIGDGVYVVSVTDSRGCEKVDSTELVEPAQIFTSGFTKNVSCHDKNDGFIDITAYGGTLPYYYSWSNLSSTEDIGGLPGNDYYVTVTDANGCQAVSLYIVTEPALLTVDVVGTDITCFGQCDGQVAAVPAGGTTPYQYLWNNFLIDSSQTGVCAGAYRVLLTDSNGCQAFDSLNLISPSEIIIDGAVTDVYCNGFSTGVIAVAVTGGTPSYTYAWSGGQNTPTITNLTAGTYTLTVTDSKGCTKTQTFTVGEIAGMHTTASNSQPTCFGGNNGFISVVVTGGTSPYVYNWSTTPSQVGATATNLTAGVYTLTVSDMNNCSATVTSTLADPVPITISVSPTGSKCYNTATGMVVVTATGGLPPYTYVLNGLVQSTDTFYNLSVGSHIIVVRDINGCEATQGFEVTAPDPITVDLVAPQYVILQGMTTALVATASSPSSPVINYYWSPGFDSIFTFENCTDKYNCSNPNVKPLYTTVFTVTAMNADSCYATDTATIIVEVEPSAYIPTAFSPNGDGLNDRFEFDILGATQIEIEIYDRWGHLTYANKNQPNGITGNNGWDGKLNGKVVPFDTYVWQMRVTYFNGIVKDKSGTVTIMK